MGCIWELLGEALQDNGPFISFQAETSNQSAASCMELPLGLPSGSTRRDQPVAILITAWWYPTPLKNDGVKVSWDYPSQLNGKS